jgi:aminoglycoside phosphotransferase (APT) family kinase protein
MPTCCGPNLLVDGGRVRAVIDFGAAGRGDPAADVIPAWSVFGPVGRACFRARLDVDDDTWNRARGYALHQAAQIVRTTATAIRPSPLTLAAPSPRW